MSSNNTYELLAMEESTSDPAEYEKEKYHVFVCHDSFTTHLFSVFLARHFQISLHFPRISIPLPFSDQPEYIIQQRLAVIRREQAYRLNCKLKTRLEKDFLER